MVDTILPLRVSDALVTRGKKRILGPVSLTLEGEGLTIALGPNGAGKTTLLRMMHGMERLASGTSTWSQGIEIAFKKQAFVFQRPIMMRRSVLDNMTYPLRLRGMSKGAAQKAAMDWLDRVGLTDAAGRMAPRLSGGEKQKLALARALILEPEVLFLDEPCANLDGRAIREIEGMLQDARAGGTRIVMSTHDLGQARRLADDVLFLYRGKVHESGPAKRFFDRPETPEAAAFVKGEIVE